MQGRGGACAAVNGLARHVTTSTVCCACLQACYSAEQAVPPPTYAQVVVVPMDPAVLSNLTRLWNAGVRIATATTAATATATATVTATEDIV